MQRICCALFACALAISVLNLCVSLRHTQSRSGEYWSHRCHDANGVENDLESCKSALQRFEGIEVDVRWNGVEAWNNESFWLHHDDAALSTTRLVDLLLVMKRSYSDKKVFLDCKFGGVRLELRDIVARHLLATVESFNLTHSNVVIAWNVDVGVDSPFLTVSEQGVLVETFWIYWFKYWTEYPTEYTIVFTQQAFEIMLWMIPCLAQCIFDEGVDVILWKSWGIEECEGLYPTLFAWRLVFCALVLGVLLQTVVFLAVCMRVYDAAQTLPI